MPTKSSRWTRVAVLSEVLLAGFVHLTVAGLDAESFAVCFPDLARSAPHFPDRVEELLAPPLARLLVRVALAGHADRHAGPAVLAVHLGLERVLVVSVVPLQQGPQAGNRLRRLRFASAGNSGNDETDLNP